MIPAHFLVPVSLLVAGVVPASDGVWPVDGTRVVAPFAPPAHDWNPGHRGVDLTAPPGTSVRSMTAGRVVFAGRVAGKPVVSVELGDGRRVTYEPVEAVVSAGHLVSPGDLLGVVARGGDHCAGSCLHVGLRTSAGYADPLSLLARRPAVLKPL